MTLIVATWMWLAAAQQPDALQTLLRELGQKRCEEAFAVVSQVKVPEKRGPESLKAARAIASGVSACGDDPAIALPLTSLAVRLAPEEPQVLVAHAEILIAVKAPDEAARTLDGVLARHGDYSPARLLRGKLAAADGDRELAARTLAPLAGDAEYKEQVAAILGPEQPRANQGTEEAQAQKLDEAVLKARQIRAPVPSASGPRVIESFPDVLQLGGELSFQVKGLIKGQQYLFLANGLCKRVPKVEWIDVDQRVVKHNRSAISGLDFRVQFGSQPSRQVYTGDREPDRNEIPFIADAAEMAIRVFDDSRTDSDVECTISGFAVAAP